MGWVIITPVPEGDGMLFKVIFGAASGFACVLGAFGILFFVITLLRSLKGDLEAKREERRSAVAIFVKFLLPCAAVTFVGYWLYLWSDGTPFTIFPYNLLTTFFDIRG